MSGAPFIHLRARSAYSLAEGAIQIPDLVKLAAGDAMPALALTDHSNLFGALEFALAASRAGIQPIPGALVELAPDEDGHLADSLQWPRAPILLLAATETGWHGLKRLVSQMYLEGSSSGAPVVTLGHLADHADGVIALTGAVPGPLGQLLAAGKAESAETLLERLQSVFADRLYMELHRHGTDADAALEPEFLRLAHARDIPIVATNDVYFSGPEMHAAHECLLCIRDSTTILDDRRVQLTPNHCFRSQAAMAELFADLPEALANTAVIARRCSHVLTARTPILPRVPDTGGRSDAEVLAERAERGLEERLDRHVFTAGMTEGERREQGGRYADRLQRELEIIRETGYDGYFLIVGEVMNWSREQTIPVGPGRGSGAGSVVAWALGITDVDPLRFGLLFERFLNPERVSMPDFDLDFCQQRREEVIAHVRELYGDDRVAQIITFGSLKARAVVRDVGRTLGLSYSKVDELAKQVPENPANPISLSEALQSEPGLQEARATDGDVERLFEIALALEGLNRNVSTHAAGLVIGDRPIEELVPLYRDPRSEIAATQYDMKRVEQAGLVKFDFLGLKTLTSMDLAVRLLRERGTELDLEALPLDDGATYALLTSGETGGIFQLESPMMREVLRRLQPNRIEDLVAILALYRPGPMDNIPSFIERRRGREAIAYPHEKLRDILEETSGIWVYQEQVMETAQVLAGFSLGEADILRRAMGKKIKSEMQALEADFVDRSVRNQVPREVAVDIFADLEKFAGYGFNKSHAVAYALISYRTAYLKAHHPADFFAAMMTIESGNRDKLNLFHDEITRRGISLLPPDINRSRTEFTVEAMTGNQPAVRCGLGTLRGVGNAAMDVVVNERDRAGPFADLWDLARRSRKADLNKEHFENLAEGGALDRLLAGVAQDQARAVAHAAAQMAARCGQEAATEERLSQSSLFGDEASAQELWVLPEAEAWERSEMLAREFAVLGFYGSGHPLEQHAQQLAAMHAVPLREASRQEAGTAFRVAGVVAQVKERVSQQKRRFARVRLSDATGAEEVMVFPETLIRYRDVLREGASLLVEVTREADSSRADSLIAHDFALLEDGGLERELPPGWKVWTDDSFDIAALFDLLETARPGNGRVEVVFPLDGDLEADMNLGVSVRLGRSLRLAVERLSGVTGVEELPDQEGLSHTV